MTKNRLTEALKSAEIFRNFGELMSRDEGSVVALADEIERLRAALDEADDLLCCADASEDLEGATAEEWDEQKEAWRQRHGFGKESAPEPDCIKKEDYYIGPTGGDTNTGTASKPYTFKDLLPEVKSA